MGVLRVLSPGIFDTVQDLGRPGYAVAGVPRSGAADPVSLRAANMLVGSPPGSPAIEITLKGGRYRFDSDAVVALAGAAMPAALGESEEDPAPRPIASGRTVRARAGEVLTIGPAASGARCYLAIAGGLRVPMVLGSASTLASAGLGGVEGRALRRGDALEFESHGPPEEERVLPAALDATIQSTLGGAEIRVVVGPHAARFPSGALPALRAGRFVISTHSNRAGLRLDGPRVPPPPGGRMLSEGMVIGAVQITEACAPIILLPDGPTTGGYPVLACVISADWPRLGQARPGDVVSFREVTLAEARRAARDLSRILEEAAGAPRG